jgi:ankyrin repeat protein
MSSRNSEREKVLILSYFFHGRGNELQKTPLGFYRSILYELLIQVPSALSHLLKDFKKNCDKKGKPGRDWDWHIAELQAYFESSIPAISEDHSILVFVDALDEGGEMVAVQLVEEFQNFLALPTISSTSIFSICFTCRHYPIPAVKLNGAVEICVELENTEDITTYIQGRLPDEKQQIRDMIIQLASNSFQWARLVTERVRQLRRRGKVEKTIKEEIQSIPPDLDNLYRGLLESVTEEERPEVLKFMQWILFATRPLSLDELRFAMAMDVNLPYMSIRQYEDEGLLTEHNEEMERRVKSLSRGLAEIYMPYEYGIPIVQFIHQSVNDFLIKDGLQILLGDGWECLDSAVGWAHLKLSKSCIRYGEMEEIIQRKDWDLGTAKFPFLRYATTSWVPHAEQAHSRGIPQDDLLKCLHWPSNDSVRRWVDIYNIIDKGYTGCPFPKTTLLHLASRYGMIRLVSQALETIEQSDVDIDTEDEVGRTPLWWAALCRHEDIAMLLLKKGANIESRDRNNLTLLLWATMEGYQAVVQFLLDKGTEVDAKDKENRTPLSWAARYGNKAVVQVLLERGADIESRDKYNQTPLLLAAKYKHEAVIQLLVEKGADIGSKGERGDLEMLWATRNGHEGLVKLVLEKRAGVNTIDKDEHSRIPVLWTVENRQEAIGRLLQLLGSEKGIDVRINSLEGTSNSRTGIS